MQKQNTLVGLSFLRVSVLGKFTVGSVVPARGTNVECARDACRNEGQEHKIYRATWWASLECTESSCSALSNCSIFCRIFIIHATCYSIKVFLATPQGTLACFNEGQRKGRVWLFLWICYLICLSHLPKYLHRVISRLLTLPVVTCFLPLTLDVLKQVVWLSQAPSLLIQVKGQSGCCQWGLYWVNVYKPR